MLGARLPGAFDHWQPPLPCENTIDAIIPPFAVMAVTAITRESGDDLGIGPMVISVKKPSSTEENDPNLSRLVFNGPRAIPATSGGTTGRGSCYLATPAFVQVAASGIALGATVGPTDDSWTLSTNGSGFAVRKVWTSGSSYMGLIEAGGGSAGPSAAIAKTGGSAIPARSGNVVNYGIVSIYEIDGGALTDTGTTEEAHNIWPFVIPANYYIEISKEKEGGLWIVKSPGIVNIRYSDPHIQYTIDGTNWKTWHTTTACP